MAKQEPPRRRSAWPIGTRAELEGNKFWRLDEWPTCGPPDRLNGVIGCPAWDECPFVGGEVFDHDTPEYRGVSGPAHFGVQQIKRSGSGEDKVVHTIMRCWEIPRRADELEDNNGVLRIIALEGETIELPGSRPFDEDIPGQGRVRIWKREAIASQVPYFPRPKENPALRGNAFAAEQARKYKESRRQGRTAEYMGAVEGVADAEAVFEGKEPKKTTIGPKATRG